MKTYEVQETPEGNQIIVATEGNLRISFMPRRGNRHYAEYLRYTAWVEAGNTPEDFWTQDEELETLEETQVTEKEETNEGES